MVSASQEARNVLVGPTIRRRRLGTDLRRLREQRALRLEEVASELGVAPSTLSRIETGKAPTRTSYLSLMLDLYGVDDAEQRRSFMELAREGQRRGWWAGSDDVLAAGLETYLGLEAEASLLHAFAADVLPDLVQNEGYAREVIVATRPDLTAEQAGRLAAVQLRRQEVLDGTDPIRLRLVLDESVLLRSLGPADMMTAQLSHLARMTSRQTVDVRVLALRTAPRPALAPSFGILSFSDPGDEDVGFTTGLRGQVLIEQRAAEVHVLRLMFDALAESALPPAESAALISRAAAQALM